MIMNNNETNLNLKCSYLSDRNVSISEQGLRKTHKLMKKDPISVWYALVCLNTSLQETIGVNLLCQTHFLTIFFCWHREHGALADFFYRSDVNTEWSIDTTTSTLIRLYIHYVILSCTFASSASELSSPLQGFVIGKKYKISVLTGTYITHLMQNETRHNEYEYLRISSIFLVNNMEIFGLTKMEQYCCFWFKKKKAWQAVKFQSITYQSHTL